MAGSGQIRRANLWVGLVASLWGCPDDADDAANDVDRPSGMVLVERSDRRSDLFLADSEADGVRVIQFEVDPLLDLDSRDLFDFLEASFVLQPLAITAPGFPTDMTAVVGRSSDRVFGLAPGESVVHAIYAPELPFQTTTDLFDGGYARIGSIVVNRAGFDDPTALDLGGLVPTVSLAFGSNETNALLTGSTPVALQVVDEAPIMAASSTVTAGVRTRLLLALQPEGLPDQPGQLVLMDVVTQSAAQVAMEPELLTSFGVALDRGGIGVEAMKTFETVPSPREIIPLREGQFIVTSVFTTVVDDSVDPVDETGVLDQLEVDGLGAPLALRSVGRIPTFGPVVTGASLDGEGFIAVRANAGEATFYDCRPSQCLLSQENFTGPFDDVDRPLGPGRLALREPPAATATFARARFAVGGGFGTSLVLDPLNLPGSGVVQLVHQDGVAAFLAGPLDRMEIVTQRERTFFVFDLDESEFTSVIVREPLNALREIFARNPSGEETSVGQIVDGGLVSCANQAAEEPPQPPGLMCMGGIPDEPEDNPRAPSSQCLEEELVGVGPRPFNSFLRATFRGPLFELANVPLLTPDVVPNDSFVFDLRDPGRGFDFTESMIVSRSEESPGDRVNLFFTCETEDDTELEIVFADLGVLQRAGEVIEVTPNEIRIALGEPLIVHDRAVVGGEGGGPSAPALDFVEACTRFDFQRIEVFPWDDAAVLTSESVQGTIIEVLDRVPLDPDPAPGFETSVRFEGDLDFVWATGDPSGASEGFRCVEDLGLDFRDPDSQAIDDTLRLLAQTSTVSPGSPPNSGIVVVPVSDEEGQNNDSVSDLPCLDSDGCGPGRSCSDAGTECPGLCSIHCGTFGDCFIFQVTRSCPEVEFGINGEDPVLESLSAGFGGAPPAAIPDSSVFVPERNSFITSFPGSRTVREIQLGQIGLLSGFID
ncbi:MAG: hypothetical protein ACFB9M_11700 [Myxococcota bacterium]